MGQMGVTTMRVFTIAAAAALLTLAAAPSAGACEELSMAQAQPAAIASAVPAATELSAEAKKKAAKVKKVKKPKEKVEYMRAAPSK